MTPLPFAPAPWCRDSPNRLTGQVVRRWWACVCLLLSLCGVATAQSAVDPLTTFELTPTVDGVTLDFATNFDLSPAVEAALQKGVSLNFVVDVQVFRERWYWRDERVARASKTWRLSYQPLTRQYRVGFGGLNQSFDALPEALTALQRVTHWKVADAADMTTAGQYRVQFTYQLDTSQLPRPMQIGIGGQSEWSLFIQKAQRLPPWPPVAAAE